MGACTSSGRRLEQDVGELERAVAALKSSTASFNERVGGTINVLAKRLDRVENSLLVTSAKYSEKHTEKRGSLSLAAALSELNDHSESDHAAVYQQRNESLRRRYSTHSLDGLEPYQVFQRDFERVNIYGKKHEVWLRAQPGEGFGITFVEAISYVRNPEMKPLRGNFIKAMRPGGCAARDNRLCQHDRVFAVNGVDVEGATQAQLVSMIKASGTELRLVVASLEKVKRFKNRFRKTSDGTPNQ